MLKSALQDAEKEVGGSLDKEYRRMCWASRRGMLELDLVLEPFMETVYASLSACDRDRYRQLMACEDQQLFAWLLRRETPEDEDLAAIVQRILDARHPGP